MERQLSTTIYVADDGSARIEIIDNETSDCRTFFVHADTNCNDADELARYIGYEILSWVDIERNGI